MRPMSVRRGLITFGPASFPAYACLRHLPDPVLPDMRESDVWLPSRRSTEIDMARAATIADDPLPLRMRRSGSPLGWPAQDQAI